MESVNWNDLPVVPFARAAGLLALTAALLEVMVADALTFCGKATSVPSFEAAAVVEEAFFAIALGSNFPAYGTGAASSWGVSGDAGDAGDATAGETNAGDATAGDSAADGSCAFLSISSSKPRVPPAASSSFCFRSFSAACFCFHASSLARRSAFFSSSVCFGGGGFAGNYIDDRD